LDLCRQSIQGLFKLIAVSFPTDSSNEVLEIQSAEVLRRVPQNSSYVRSAQEPRQQPQRAGGTESWSLTLSSAQITSQPESARESKAVPDQAASSLWSPGLLARFERGTSPTPDNSVLDTLSPRGQENAVDDQRGAQTLIFEGVDVSRWTTAI